MLNNLGIHVIDYPADGIALFYDEEGAFVMTRESDEIQPINVVHQSKTVGLNSSDLKLISRDELEASHS